METPAKLTMYLTLLKTRASLNNQFQRLKYHISEVVFSKKYHTLNFQKPYTIPSSEISSIMQMWCGAVGRRTKINSYNSKQFCRFLSSEKKNVREPEQN